MSQHKGRINIEPLYSLAELNALQAQVGDIATVSINGVTDFYEYTGTKYGWMKTTDPIQYLVLEDVAIDAAYPDPVVVDQVIKQLP